MNIAIVFDGLGCGGIERVGLDYIKILRELGHDITVFNLRPKLNDLEKEVEDAELDDISFPRWFAPERYAATLKRVAWGRYIYPIAYVLFSLVLLIYKPIVRLVHGSTRKKYDVCIAFSGHINDLTFVAKAFVRGKHKVSWIHGALFEYAIMSPGYVRLFANIKNLVTLSDCCDAEMWRFMRENNINKQTIYNPTFISDKQIDITEIEALKKEYGDFCLMVARFDDDKDQKTAIDAICILKEKHNLSKKLLLVGDGKTRETLEQYVRDKGLEQSVFFMGKRSDVQNYYSAATIYVHSSPMEGLPTVLLEAMSYHLPIAATDSVPGVREILGNEKCGLISRIFDAEDLADNISKLYLDEEERERIICASDDRVKDFSPTEIKNKLESYLASLE